MIRKCVVGLVLSCVAVLTGMAQEAPKVAVVSIEGKLVMAGGFQVAKGNAGTLTAKEIEVCYETTNCGSVDLKVSLAVNYSVKAKCPMGTVHLTIDLPIKSVTKTGLAGSAATTQFCEMIEDISVTGDEVFTKIDELRKFVKNDTLKDCEIQSETDYTQKFSVSLIAQVVCAGRDPAPKDEKAAGAQINQGDLKKGQAEKKLKFHR